MITGSVIKFLKLSQTNFIQTWTCCASKESEAEPLYIYIFFFYYFYFIFFFVSGCG